MNNEESTVEVYVKVPDEDGALQTRAIALDNGFYKILARPDYNPQAEDWEFPPGTIVRCEWIHKGFDEPLFLAVSSVAL